MTDPSSTDSPATAVSERAGSDAVALDAARAADAKGATRPVVLRVGDVLGVTELFVVASASNTRLVKAVAEEVEERLGVDHGVRPLRIEGLDDLRWVLMDYGDWVAHIFLDEARELYDLERLWADVPRVAWDAA